ncbi:transglutaminase family protein [Aliikangiella coralliicola]|uniref:Protein SirB1 N-terminal domain-containing protein n=1 Tax=Aliikangiella coralliicola TaxID=2592383 RepID=A0A545UA62_9GAMM|nr:transglutaminase family protein [Aliikangiella coralliicola]TQV86350.1 hypothetical protein FLL46_15615 [Aliikangiella coralliicola]
MSCFRWNSLFVVCIAIIGVVMLPMNVYSQSQPRQKNNTLSYSIWSPLTELEIATLNQVSKAKSGDADALLMLYLMASGDSRHFSDLRRHQKTIERFINANKSVINEEKSEWRKGYLLHKAMHEYFFLGGNSRKNAGKGYYFEQSQLSEIFYSKRFNCVSSALLYTVLARKFNLDVEAVLLPSHVFVQLNLSDGKKIEIETTSISGYDWVHDKDFYEKEDLSWFNQRGLTPSTYQDYQNREIVSPFQLGVQNMYNQHTFEERMRRDDRFRMAELLTSLDKSNIKAHKHRLNFYNDEFVRLKNSKDFRSLNQMYERISAYLQSLVRFASQDKELANILAWVDSQRAYTLLEDGKLQNAVGLAKKVLNELRNKSQAISDADKIKNNVYVTLNKAAKKLVDNGEFESALKIFGDNPTDCLKSDDCTVIRYLYSRWTSSYWNQKQWTKAIAKYQEFLKLESEGEAAEMFKRNMQGAHINWANTYYETGDWQQVKRILTQCVNADNNADKCRSHLTELQERHRLD